MSAASPRHQRLRLALRGAVQGVGFRPFVFRLAAQLQLRGWVVNSAQGLFIEVEGPSAQIEQFLLRLPAEKPPRSAINSLEASWLDPVGYPDFAIRPTQTAGPKTALVLPDIATCPDCLREILDPANRRYFYPFTNCTNCGPRFSILDALPYDRANTSMKHFAMCAHCQREYDDPRDRRFHAQPNACPDCGPSLALWDSRGVPCGFDALPTGSLGASASSLEPRASSLKSPPPSGQLLAAAAAALRAGAILALKGLGGFHLLVAAHDDQAVRRLRERKHREEKPLALMFPSLPAVRAVCDVSPAEERLLCSPEAPIVLLRRRASSTVGQVPSPGATVVGQAPLPGAAVVGRVPSPGAPPAIPPAPEPLPIAPSVAPGNPNLGIMLPYTPLHHLLLSLLGFPVVATSGNLSDEPICTDEREALARLGAIADLFLVHNRPIVRHVDDSIVRVMVGRELVLRRARGYAPLPLPLDPRPSFVIPHSSFVIPQSPPPSTLSADSALAVGAHLKNTVGLAIGPLAFLSQHIGDLETQPAYDAFGQVVADLQRLYDAAPAKVVADFHPDYLSTRFARELGLPCFSVQHHLAHVLACMAENELAPPILGVAWDGTGYGLDGSVWGGEFFLLTTDFCARAAHFRPFRLPGGEQAIKEPRRTALGLLFEALGDAAFARDQLAPLRAFSPAQRRALATMLRRQVNSPLTSSVGRLFDAVASITGLRQRNRFEGQAAMQLEFALENTRVEEAYPLSLLEPSIPGPAPLPRMPDGQWSRTAGAGAGWPMAAGKSPRAEGRGPRAGFKSQISKLESGAGNRRSEVGNLESETENQKSESPSGRLPLILDWSPLVAALLADLKCALPAGVISAKFHNALAEAIVAVAKRLGQRRVALSGGCFQNRYLTERAVQRLEAEGLRVYWHQRVPPNDGGIALGQLVAARLTR